MNVILEKDYRKSILNIKVSDDTDQKSFNQEVADYLHALDHKRSLLFAEKINQMPEYHAATDKLAFVKSLESDITSILNWVKGPGKNIKLAEYSWEDALQNAKEYTFVKTEETKTIIKKYKDGFYWADLESQSDSCEKKKMNHCGSTNDGDTLYSLRKYNKESNEIDSYITIAVSPDKGQWYQCKGRGNAKPDKKFYSYIVDILIEKEVFEYIPEFREENDFTAEDFKQYVRENKDEYPNADEILEKLKEEPKVTFGDFEEILNNYQKYFKYFSIYIDEYDTAYDEDPAVFANYNFGITIEPEEDLPIECLKMKWKSPAYNYFKNLMDTSVDNLSVESHGDDFMLYATLEDSESLFKIDEDGLRDFERQCEFYKRLNEEFDEEEFLTEHLKKMLILDGCIETEINIFKDKIEEDFKDFYSVEQNDKTLDLTIKSRNSFDAEINKKNLSFWSVLKKASDKTILPSAKTLLDDPYFEMKSHADYLLLAIFWDFIKRNVLITYSKHMEVIYDGVSFNIKFRYDFDDEKVDYDKEYEFLKDFENSSEEITKGLNKFMNEIFEPVIMNKIPMTNDDLDIRPMNYGGVSVYSKDDRYITYEPDVAQKMIEDKKLDYGYHDVNKEEILNWLESNIETESELPTFKEFFQNRYL